MIAVPLQQPLNSTPFYIEMEERPIRLILQDNSHIEHTESNQLRVRALDLVTIAEDVDRFSELPDTLLELLAQIIKPLFSKEHHSKLTSTGRKNLVDNALPAAFDRFSADILFDSDRKPLWKNGWTASLLKFVLSCYSKFQDEDVRRKTLEAHFYQLIPPMLHQIDDIDIIYKVTGCKCLELLCNHLGSVRSEILKQSGLADVFIEALKNNFSLLPTLTPEDDSLTLYKATYPAYRSLVKARFTSISTTKSGATSSGSNATTKTKSKPQNAASEEQLRQSYLTLILRHQLLHSLSHLSTGVGGGSTSSIPLSTFLLAQLQWIFMDMGIASVVHLQTILPLIRNVVSDPFGTASPEMLLESIKSLVVIVRMAWPRIRDKWWGECLRGVVNCWLNVVDDEKDVREQGRHSLLAQVKHELKVVTCVLEDIVGEPLLTAKFDYINEEPLLEALFDGKI